MTTRNSAWSLHLLRFFCAAGGLASCSPAADLTAAGPITIDPSCTIPAQGLPDDVFCTGLYQDRDSTRYAEPAIPYKPGVVLWSDGAQKQRYFYLPPGTKIDTSDMDAWKFPAGTRAWKEFRLNGALVETRLFWKRDDATWESGTYVWDKSATTATLNTSTTAVIVTDGYEIPTARNCGKCHHGGADGLLGVEAVALALSTAEGLTLSRLVLSGSLSQPPPTTSVALPEDATGKAAEALGYLHANCGMPCHSTRGLGEETKLVLRLRADEIWPSRGEPVPVAMTDTYMATVNQDPTTAAVAHAFPGARRLVPGAHDQSLIWLLADRRDPFQMPPLVSHHVDTDGMQKLGDWIDALPK